MELASDHRKDPGLLLTFLVVIRALEAVGTSASLPCSLPLGLRPEGTHRLFLLSVAETAARPSKGLETEFVQSSTWVTTSETGFIEK